MVEKIILILILIISILDIVILIAQTKYEEEIENGDIKSINIEKCQKEGIYKRTISTKDKKVITKHKSLFSALNIKQ